MDLPWKTLAPVNSAHQYLALLSYLPLRSYGKIPVFFWFTLQINRQLRATPGAIGYSMRTNMFSRRFWTLSVWESDRALMDFVGNGRHRKVMKDLAPHIGATTFTRWKLLGSGVPPRWEDAVRRSIPER
jgi:Domain of unknown function (DUF3291)